MKILCVVNWRYIIIICYSI